MATAEAALQRQDVPQDQRWNSEALFASWDAWQAELDGLAADLPKLSAFEGTLSQGPDRVADWLKLSVEQSRRLMRLMVYVRMSTDVDANDTVAQGKLGEMMAVASKFSAGTAFADPELLALGDTLMEWVKSEPRLNIYEQHVNNLLRQKPHTRSAEVEEILGMLQDPFGQTFQTMQQLSSADLTFEAALDADGKTHPVGQATVPPTGIQSEDRTQRQNAWQNFCDGYLSMKNTFTSNYLASVKQSVFTARVRGYDSVLAMRLAPFNMPESVYHNLVDTFKKNISVWHRYWEAKRKALGVEKLHPFDIWAPIIKGGPNVPYEQSIEWIADAMMPLGDEYVSAMRKGCLDDGWVDHAPNIGKMQGARANPCYDSMPYIITSYDNTLMGVSVLTHEIGHSMHGLLIDQAQPGIYNGYGNISMAAAETASNFHQVLTRAHLKEKFADDEIFQLALIDETMFNFHRYFFIMPTLVQFEYEVHERIQNGQALTVDALNEIMSGLFAEGYGSTMTDDAARTAITWAQFGHLYIPFYTFQYSLGISAAHAAGTDVLGGVPNAAENYLNFLKSGGSMDSLDSFMLANVDMASPEPIEKTFAILESWVERLESLS